VEEDEIMATSGGYAGDADYRSPRVRARPRREEAAGESAPHGAGEIIDVRPLLFRQVTEAL
jgi:hypothetical protein